MRILQVLVSRSIIFGILSQIVGAENILRLVCVGGESRRQSESGLTNAKANNKQQHPQQQQSNKDICRGALKEKFVNLQKFYISTQTKSVCLYREGITLYLSFSLRQEPKEMSVRPSIRVCDIML